MICPKCTAEILDGFSFCPQCGYSLPEKQEDTRVVPEIVSAADTTSFVVESKEEDPDFDDRDTSVNGTDDISSEDTEPVLKEQTFEEFVLPTAVADPAPSNPAIPSDPAVSPVSVSETVSPSMSTETKAVAEIRQTPVTQIPSAAATTPGVSQEPVIPKTHKPLTTGGVFWYFFVTAIPVVGFLILVIVAAASKNLNRKSLSRSILLWHLVAVLLLCSLFTALFFLNQPFLIELFDFNNWFMTFDFILRTFMY